VKSGARVLGVAESYPPDVDHSTLAGALVRGTHVVDGLSFARCTVSGSDATEGVVACYDRLDREDVRYVLVAGIALAWYNVVDCHAVHDAVDRPVLSVTFEASDGLEPALREAFDGDELESRLATYRRQPDRTPVTVNEETVYVRAVGCSDEEAREVVRTVTPAGGRPEPLRVARFAARAGADLLARVDA
jgi:endonuclease V-like protein UPF0215 family